MVFKPQTFHVLPPQAEMDDPMDAVLEADVAEALARAGALDASRIDVTIRGAAACLEGFVGSRSEVDVAGEIAGQVDGVKVVDNRLMVQAAVV
ncbi:MAG: BON domain-containing protein [Rhizobium sp.]|nr:BON domain-containing protein [Rhizobium sp.]